VGGEKGFTVFRVTDTTFPILCLQSIGRITREDIERVRPIYDAAYARNQPLLCVSDARLAQHDATQRKLYAEWTAHCFKMDRGLTKGTIIILDSALLRGALTALNWIVPPKIPQTLVPDPLEAIEAGRRLTEKFGITVAGETWGHIRLWIEQGRAKATG
jgi:hypothetical protein